MRLQTFLFLLTLQLIVHVWITILHLLKHLPHLNIQIQILKGAYGTLSSSHMKNWVTCKLWTNFNTVSSKYINSKFEFGKILVFIYWRLLKGFCKSTLYQGKYHWGNWKVIRETSVWNLPLNYRKFVVQHVTFSFHPQLNSMYPSTHFFPWLNPLLYSMK